MSTKLTATTSFRLVASVIGMLMMAMLIWTTSRAALSSRYVARAAKDSNVTDSDRGLVLNRSDADANLLRGAFYEVNDDLSSAVDHYERAVALRPQDYVLWLTLARARELNGEPSKAIAAARMAVPLAPFYAQTHWQLGNLLVRAGETAEGFKELRLASSINSDFLPPVTDLAWQLSKGDVQFVKDTIRPEGVGAYLALADCFNRRGKIDEAIEMFAAAGNDPQVAKRRQQFVGELIAAKKFPEAYRLWMLDRNEKSSSGIGVLVDGGFEQESDLDKPGFGWRADNKAASITRSLDSSGVKEGRSSLRLDFNGDSDENVSVISQFVLIEPRAHYRLQFAARAEEIVSGGLPALRVVDAATGKVLGEATGISQSRDWRDYSIDFAAGESAGAIEIILVRKPCNARPCPIFGRLWLDALSLQKSDTPTARV